MIVVSHADNGIYLNMTKYAAERSKVSRKLVKIIRKVITLKPTKGAQAGKTQSYRLAIRRMIGCPIGTLILPYMTSHPQLEWWIEYIEAVMMLLVRYCLDSDAAMSHLTTTSRTWRWL